MPDALAYLWQWFRELERTRQGGYAGLQPMTYAEILAWATLTGREPQPRDVDALILMDAAMRVGMRSDG